jgi:hypothetical protein
MNSVDTDVPKNTNFGIIIHAKSTEPIKDQEQLPKDQQALPNDKEQLPIKNRQPQLITLKAVDWNPTRLLQRIQTHGFQY